MCRFTASLAPPAAPVQEQNVLDTLLGEDDFNWFDAIDAELGDVDVEELAGAAQACESKAAGSDVDAAALEQQQQASPQSSGGSSYDLVGMFKQQVAQQPLAPGAVMPQFVAPFQAVLPGAAYAVMPPQLLAAPMGPAAGPFLAAAAAAAAAPAAPAMQATAAPGAATAAAPSLGPSSTCGSSRGRRGHRTQEEIDAAVERIKQKRRESAQRSRARKNDYMRQLELENQALRDEVQRLQQVLAAVQRTTFQQHLPAAALVQLAPMM